MANRKKSGAKSGKIVIFVIEFLVIAALLFVLIKFVIPATRTTESGGLNVVKIDETKPEEIRIALEVQKMSEDGGTMTEYLNIALFGIDSTSTSVSSLEKGF